MLNIQFAFPRMAEESFPVSLVENRNDATTAADMLVARDSFDLEAFRWRCDVVCGDAVGGGTWCERS